MTTCHFYSAPIACSLSSDSRGAGPTWREARIGFGFHLGMGRWRVLSMAAADWNNDGYADLVFAHDDGYRVLLNDGPPDGQAPRRSRLVFGLGVTGTPLNLTVRWPGPTWRTQVIDDDAALEAAIGSMERPLVVVEPA